MQKHNSTRYIPILLAVFAAMILTAGCADPQKKLNEAKSAENSGDHRKALGLFAALAIESSPSLTLPEASKGKVIKPDIWMNDMDRYVKWFTGSAARKNDFFSEALSGMERASGRFEPENTAVTPAPTPLDSLPAFAAQWNAAFNPPPSGSADWDGLVKRAADLNFSILRMSAPKSYTYDVNIISRKNSHRVNFTLFAENQTLVPLPPGDYLIIVKSRVDFQEGQRWTSEFSALELTVPNAQTLIPLNMKTRVARRE